jgi:hypothetical protein
MANEDMELANNVLTCECPDLSDDHEPHQCKKRAYFVVRDRKTSEVYNVCPDCVRDSIHHVIKRVIIQ